LTARRVT
jgi:Chromosome segregation ATPases